MNKFWIVPFLITAMPALAVQPYAKTPAEAAMCEARVFSRLGARDQNSIHMHHYCDGLRFLDRAYASMQNKNEMRYNLNQSIGNLDYVLTRIDEGYFMRGEVHVTKARALKLLGRRAEAVSEFNKALKYSRVSPEVYIALTDHFAETGDKMKAREMATEGLKRNPDSRALKRRYTELGGQLPYPTLAKPAVVETQDPQVEGVIAPQSPADHERSAAPPEVPPAGEKESIPEPKIGSPTNPYCRFCPD